MNLLNSTRAGPALVIGTLLGWLTACFATDAMLGGIFVVVAGAFVNALVVCLIARRSLIPLSVVPVLSCEIGLIALGYHTDHKYEGLDFSASFQHRFSMTLVFAQLVPALVVASVVYLVRNRRNAPNSSLS